MELSQYEQIGKENIKKLIRDFYREVRKDELLSPMYRDDFDGAEERLHLFMVQYLGGPDLYNQKRGHPLLKKRHAAFRVNEEAKDHWLKNMRIALDRSEMNEKHKQFLWDYFRQTAVFLKNS